MVVIWRRIRRPRPPFFKRYGLVLLCMGTIILLATFVPVLGFFLGITMILLGLWSIFFCF